MRPDTNLGVMELSGRIVSYGNDNIYRLTSETIAGYTHSVNGAVRWGIAPRKFLRCPGIRAGCRITTPTTGSPRTPRNADGIPRQPERQNDFGGRIQGPLKIPKVYDGKSKTFYFFSYGGLRLEESAITEEPIPSRFRRRLLQGPAE
jgi:hypothetical protein